MSDEDILPGDVILVTVIRVRGTHGRLERKLHVVDRGDATIEEAEGITYKRYIAEDAIGRK